MYERFFGLDELPFQLTPDTRYLFLSAKHREALGHLVFGIREGAGFVAITGEIGAGKTTLLRTLLRQADESTKYAYILNPVLTGVELLQEINHELGITVDGSRRELLLALNQYLLEQKALGRRVVLVIDEAQALDGAILEQLRLLSNFETETAKLLQIVLVGQPELHDLLVRPDLEQLNQRITVRWHLGRLDRDETVQYIAHRVATAAGGRPRDLFTRGALSQVHAYSRGVPRLINILCHRALLVAYAGDRTRVTRGIAQRAIRELRRQLPTRRRRSPAVAGWPVAAGIALALGVGGAALWRSGWLEPMWRGSGERSGSVASGSGGSAGDRLARQDISPETADAASSVGDGKRREDRAAAAPSAGSGGAGAPPQGAAGSGAAGAGAQVGAGLVTAGGAASTAGGGPAAPGGDLGGASSGAGTAAAGAGLAGGGASAGLGAAGSATGGASGATGAGGGSVAAAGGAPSAAGGAAAGPVAAGAAAAGGAAQPAVGAVALAGTPPSSAAPSAAGLPAAGAPAAATQPGAVPIVDTRGGAEPAAGEGSLAHAGGAAAPTDAARPAPDAPAGEPSLAPAAIERATLNEALRQVTPGNSAYEATEALLRMWGVPQLSPQEASSRALDLPSIARVRGLEYVTVSGNLNLLRVLDLPAILEVAPDDASDWRFVTLRRLDDDGATLVVGRGTVDVSTGVLAEAWYGKAHVLWRDLDRLGPVLAMGAVKPEVRKLHGLLRDAGVYEGLDSPTFSPATEAAVQRFQRSHRLLPDGKAGPMTIIALYQSVAGDRVPHLARVAPSAPPTTSPAAPPAAAVAPAAVVAPAVAPVSAAVPARSDVRLGAASGARP